MLCNPHIMMRVKKILEISLWIDGLCHGREICFYIMFLFFSRFLGWSVEN